MSEAYLLGPRRVSEHAYPAGLMEWPETIGNSSSNKLVTYYKGFIIEALWNQYDLWNNNDILV